MKRVIHEYDNYVLKNDIYQHLDLIMYFQNNTKNESECVNDKAKARFFITENLEYSECVFPRQLSMYYLANKHEEKFVSLLERSYLIDMIIRISTYAHLYFHTVI